jgi:hypothetical protein
MQDAQLTNMAPCFDSGSKNRGSLQIRHHDDLHACVKISGKFMSVKVAFIAAADVVEELHVPSDVELHDMSPVIQSINNP